MGGTDNLESVFSQKQPLNLLLFLVENLGKHNEKQDSDGSLCILPETKNNSLDQWTRSYQGMGAWSPVAPALSLDFVSWKRKTAEKPNFIFPSNLLPPRTAAASYLRQIRASLSVKSVQFTVLRRDFIWHKLIVTSRLSRKRSSSRSWKIPFCVRVCQTLNPELLCRKTAREEAPVSLLLPNIRNLKIIFWRPLVKKINKNNYAENTSVINLQMLTVLRHSAATGPESPALFWHLSVWIFPSKSILQYKSNAKLATHYIYGTKTKCVKTYLVKRLPGANFN